MISKNFQSIRSFAILPLATAFCIAIIVSPAIAEDHKNFNNAQGVNRVIRSEPGNYSTVSGTASMNFSGVPYGGGLYADKPSFYLGASVGGSELDAGLEYESRQIGGYKPGWSAFLSAAIGNGAAKYTNPVVLRADTHQPIAWRGGVAPVAGVAVSSSLTTGVYFHLNELNHAYVSIDILKNGGRVPILENSGKFYYNNATATGPDDFPTETGAGSMGSYPDENHPIAPWIGSWVYPGDTSNVTIKRVTAMTRTRGDSTNDGSQLNCAWNGSLGAPIDQIHTGYDSPANGHMVGGVRDDVDGRGAFKTNFPNLSVSETVARTDTAASRTATQNGDSRYTFETVQINLRNRIPRGRGRGH